ncbi:MAG: CorA family divalent cation transporter [Solirubrobacterales bacterium]
MAYSELAAIYLGDDGLEIFTEEIPFARDGRVARILISDEEGNIEPDPDSVVDSSAEAWMPATDVDSDELFRFQIIFAIGAQCDVLLDSDGQVPADVTEPLVELILRHLTNRYEQDWAGVDELAEGTRDACLVTLEQRIRNIEESVRGALGDDQVSEADYEALRTFPERLARVEELAAIVEKTPDFVQRNVRPRDPFEMIRARIDWFERDAGRVAAEAREAVARMSGLLMSQQIVLTQKQAADAARFQRMITLVGAAILVPALIAGIFGANVRVPGEGSSSGFWAMLLFMVAGAVGSYALFRSVENGNFERLLDRTRLAKISDLTEVQKTSVLCAIGVAAFVVGTVLVV